MPRVVAWRTEEADAIVADIVERLRAGAVVALPTEAGYEAVAAALHPNAVADLTEVADPEATPAVLLGQAQAALDWFPHLRGAAVRLARRFWPGPLVLVGGFGAGAGLARRLPSETRAFLHRHQRLGLRLPDQPWVEPVARRLGAPLVAAPLRGFPQESARIEAGKDPLGLIVDAGPSAFTKPPSVVEAGNHTLHLRREGALAKEDLEEASRCRVLFVCTGNTCRSPLAHALCTKLLADTLGCAVAKLSERGFRVQSAGLAAMMGDAATMEAATIAQESGADLSSHESQPLTLDLVAHADHVFAMTRSHLYLLASLRLPVGPTPELLSPTGIEIDDPIGGTAEVYRACADQIRAALLERLPQLREG